MRVKLSIIFLSFLLFCSFAYASVTIDSSNVYFNTTANNVAYRFLNNITADNITINSTYFIVGNPYNESFTNVESSYVVYNLTAMMINATFFDETTLSLMSQDVDVEIVYNNDADSYLVPNATLSFYDIAINRGINYLLKYSSDGYTTRAYPLSTTLKSEYILSLYLLNETYASDVIVSVLNQIAEGLENYDVVVLRLLNGIYQQVEIAKTNFDGETSISVELDEPYYKFIIRNEDDNTVKTTTETEIFSTELTFFISEEENLLESFSKVQDLQYSFNYINATRNFKLVYTDPTSSLSNICVKVYKIDSAGKKSLYNSSCSTSVSGTIYVGVLNTTGTRYIGQAYASFSPEQYFAQTYASFVNLLPLDDEESMQTGLIITAILMLAGLFIMLWNPPIGLIMMALFLWLTSDSFLHFHKLDPMVVGLISVLLCIGAYWVSKE